MHDFPFVNIFSNYNFSKYSFFKLHFFLEKVFSNKPIFKKLKISCGTKRVGMVQNTKERGLGGGGYALSALHLPLGWGKGQLVEGIGCV